MSTYRYKKDGKFYVIYDDNTIITTPDGNNVRTSYKPLAERIVQDLDRYGMNFQSPESILSYHFTMLDYFSLFSHESAEQILTDSFLTDVDWTCRNSYAAGWTRTFGKWSDREYFIKQWLSKVTLMQMTAACCIGNTFDSLNMAFTLALIFEKYNGAEREDKLAEIAHLVADYDSIRSFESIYNCFKTFELYYGIHLEEEGTVLDDIVPDDYGEDEEDDYIDVEELSDFSVTVEQLIGRNYYHYTDWKIDDPQPASFTFSEIKLNEEDEDKVDEDEDDWFGDEDADDEDNDGLPDYLPDDCWVRRFVDDNDANIFYMMYIVLNEDGEIEESGCIEEHLHQIGGGFFTIPGMEMPTMKIYQYNSYPPEKVIDDLRLLFKGRALPLDFSFVGKKLPQAMIGEGGNGGCDTEYTYAIQSAFRLAYMHMTVYTNEDGVVEDFDYSTYQSSGSAYGDMFSRPTGLSDRKNEAMDMLLHIYDQYTDEELNCSL